MAESTWRGRTRWNWDCAGRKALVTGASKGIGRACAEVLAEEGCDVVLVSRTAADLEAARATIVAKHNVAVRFYPLDLSDSRNVDTLAAECADTDILVNNAGAIPGGDIAQIDEARWRTAWDLKVFGYINMTRRFYALMAARKKGVIVNILGAAGENPDFDYIAGSSGNASLMAFTRAMGGTAPRDGLRVIGINPGPVMTDRLITLMRTRAQSAVRRSRALDRIHEAARLRPRRQAGGDRLDGGLPRLRPLGLHDRLDHHDRRRRLQPALGTLTRSQSSGAPWLRRTAKKPSAAASRPSWTVLARRQSGKQPVRLAGDSIGEVEGIRIAITAADSEIERPKAARTITAVIDRDRADKAHRSWGQRR